MLRFLALRYFAIAALLLAVGTVDLASAASTPLSQQSHRQDLGDDDGDGIPNYLDPDDNNDGISDEDTPPTEDDNPVEPPVPSDDETSGDGSADPTPPAVPEEDPAPTQQPVSKQAEVPQQVAAPQVASLPNTGVGANVHASQGLALILLGVFSSGFMIVNTKRWLHMR